MDAFHTASLALRAQKSMPGLKDFRSWEAPDIQMPAMPAMPQNVTQNITNYSSKGWTTVRSAVSEWNAPQPQASGSRNEIPPVRQARPSAAPIRQQVDEDATQGEGMWLKVYGAVAQGATSLKTKLAGDDGYESDKDGYKGESHLCRIMKEYYIGKAQHAQDLPNWLFPPTERPTIKTWDSAPSNLPNQTSAHRSNSSSLKDIFDAPGPPQTRKQSADSGYSSYSSSASAGSRAGDRLRAMRDQRGNTAGTISLNEARGIPQRTTAAPETRRRAWE